MLAPSILVTTFDFDALSLFARFGRLFRLSQSDCNIDVYVLDAYVLSPASCAETADAHQLEPSAIASSSIPLPLQRRASSYSPKTERPDWPAAFVMNRFTWPHRGPHAFPCGNQSTGKSPESIIVRPAEWRGGSLPPRSLNYRQARLPHYIRIARDGGQQNRGRHRAGGGGGGARMKDSLYP